MNFGGHSTSIVPDATKSFDNYDFLITIYTYDPPRQLLRLLEDVKQEEQKASHKVGIRVIDDHSLSCVFQASHRNISNGIRPQLLGRSHFFADTTVWRGVAKRDVAQQHARVEVPTLQR